LEAAEALCREQSSQATQIGNGWMEDEELTASLDKVKQIQCQMEELQASVVALPLGEKLGMMQKKRELRQA